MTPPTKHVRLFTDGACSGNPGPGGYAAILQYGEHCREITGGFRKTTNNRMELMAAIKGLEALKHPCSVTLVSDSEYLVNSLLKGWARGWRAKGWRRQGKPVPNWDLWRQLLDLCALHDVRLQWVEGHAGHVENERCDLLATTAAVNDHLPADEGYERPQTP